MYVGPKFLNGVLIYFGNMRVNRGVNASLNTSINI